MPMDINQLKQIGEEVRYTGQRKTSLMEIVNLLKKNAYSRKELCEELGISNVRLNAYLNEIKEKQEKLGIKLEKRMWNRVVYYWVEEIKQ